MVMFKRPVCVAIEGVDCAGKGTMAKKVVSALKHEESLRGIPIKLVSFPDYDLPSGQMILKYLNGYYKDIKYMYNDPERDLHELEMNVDFRAMLYTMNRLEYFHTYGIDNDAIYVFDRYWFSNITHQFADLWRAIGGPEYAGEIEDYSNRNGVSPEAVINVTRIKVLQKKLDDWLNDNEAGLGLPNAQTFYLDVDYETVMYRLAHRKNNKHEGKDILETSESVKRSIALVNWLKDLYKGEPDPNAAMYFLDVKNDDCVKTIFNRVLKLHEIRVKETALMKANVEKIKGVKS